MAKVQKTSENFEKCSCSSCPSWNACSKEKSEKLFCSSETEKICSYEQNGCICGHCPVHQENNLKTNYYCVFGSADKIDETSHI